MKFRQTSNTAHTYTLAFHCPGCERLHHVNQEWQFNGDLYKPTLSPRVLVTYDGADANKPGRPKSVCHSYVRDGRIQFLTDSTHSLAGQTVDLPDLK